MLYELVFNWDWDVGDESADDGDAAPDDRGDVDEQHERIGEDGGDEFVCEGICNVNGCVVGIDCVVE